jgi:predicted ATPase
MITLIEALNYRCLRYVRQPLRQFQVLVGPNASGKSTFLDVLAFLGKLVSEGLDSAVEERTQNFRDLVWGRAGNRFELAVEATLPESVRLSSGSEGESVIRYEVAVGIEETSQRTQIIDQRILFVQRKGSGVAQGESLPSEPPDTIFEKDLPLVSTNRHNIITSKMSRPIRGRTIFNSLSQEEHPAPDWLANLLIRGVYHMELLNSSLRQPSPAGKGKYLKEDGSNLPWLVSAMQENSPDRYNEWLSHVRTALPDLEAVEVKSRPEDGTKYLMLRYRCGLEAPSWIVSDGTLRLLALTILVYAPDTQPIFLVEEPENSIHPLNIETVMQSLQSFYEGQVLVATHSPLVLGLTDPKEVLVFSRDDSQGTKIVAGSEHPALSKWRGDVNLGTLFAGGVLG